MNEKHHYEIALICHQGKRKAIVRKRIGDLSAITGEALVEDNPIFLQIRATKDSYLFSISKDNVTFSPLGSGLTRYLSTEVACGFGGVYLGIYATGNGRPASIPAFIDWFEYKPL